MFDPGIDTLSGPATNLVLNSQWAARFDPTDAERAVIEALLPTDVRGKERANDRRVLDGIFRRLRTGAPWADIPARCGSVHDLRQPLPALARHSGSTSYTRSR